MLTMPVMASRESHMNVTVDHMCSIKIVVPSTQIGPLRTWGKQECKTRRSDALDQEKRHEESLK